MAGRHCRTAVRAVAIALLIVLAATPLAVAGVPIYVNRGVSGARLGMTDKSCLAKLGRASRSGRDRSYANRVVYYFYFGRKQSNGTWPLEMYSNGSHRVFTFVCNASYYVTSKHIHVGSSEYSLRHAYGTSLKRYRGSVYTRYTLGGRTGTDFWVRGSRVRKIVVRTY